MRNLMSMKWNITIDGQEVLFKASAAIPRIYRMRFHRDIYKDLRDLDLLTIRMVNDMYVESRNDEHKYAVVATPDDFDKF